MPEHTDNSEAMRLAEACKHGWLENVDPDKCGLDDLLALLRKLPDRIAELEAERDRLLATVKDDTTMIFDLCAERDRLREGVERLRVDAERHAWLRSEHQRPDPICHLSWKRNNDRSSSEWVNTADLDAAIDAYRTTNKETE